MSLTLGKLTIIVGAGILGSVLAKEGRLPSFSDVISGAIKVTLKPTQQSDSASSTSKPRNDALMAQVNSLRQELQLLASSRPVAIVTSNGTGGRKYCVIIVIVVFGYGYVRWKVYLVVPLWMKWCVLDEGWKIPNFMFVTKRRLSDACNSVAKQLDDVFLSLRATRNDLSSKLDDSYHKCDDIVAYSNTTKEEISVVRGTVSELNVDLQTVNHKIRTLETRMGRIKEKQDETKEGVARLLLCTLDLENKFADFIQDSSSSASRQSIGHQKLPSTSRIYTSSTTSLPLALEASSPSTSNGSCEVKKLRRSATTPSDQKEYQGTSAAVDNNNNPRVLNGNHITEITEKPHGRELPQVQPDVKRAGFISRTISATRYFKFL